MGRPARRPVPQPPHGAPAGRWPHVCLADPGAQPRSPRRPGRPVNPLARLRRKVTRGVVAAVAGAVMAVAVGVVLQSGANLGRGVIHHSYELQLVARGDVRAREAVIVYLDEASYRALNQPLNAPW